MSVGRSSTDGGGQSEFRQPRVPYDPMGYMRNIGLVAIAGVELIKSKTKTYGDSWKRRGGAGAWFTTVRPWDRLETIVSAHGGDVLAAVAADLAGADGSALACIRDVRNYLTLIEAEALSSAQSRGLDMPLADGTRVLHSPGGDQSLLDTTPGTLKDAGVSSERPALAPGSSERRAALERLPKLLVDVLKESGLGDARVVQLPRERGMGSAVVLEITVDIR